MAGEGFQIAEGFIEVHGDNAPFERDVDRTLRDANTHFSAGGRESGRSFGDGVSREGTRGVDGFIGRIRQAFSRNVPDISGTFGRDLGRDLASTLPGIGATTGTATSKSMLSSIGEAFTAGGPVTMAIMGAVLAAAAPVIGALAGTALVLAFGGALAGLGLVAAFHLKSVQKEFGQFQKFLKGFMNDIGKPFEGTWKTIFDTATSVLKTFQPILKSVFSTLVAPAVTNFVKDLGAAFKQLAPSIKPMAEAFAALLAAIGPALPGIFKQISDALISIADVIKQNPALFGEMVTDFIKLVPVALQIVKVLMDVYVWISKFTGLTNPFAIFLAALNPLTFVLFHFRDTIVSVFQTVVSTASSIGSAISSAWSAITGAITSAVNAIWTVITTVWNTITTVTSTTWNGINAVISGVLGAIQGAFSLVFNLISAIVSTVFNVIHAIIFGDMSSIYTAISSGLASIQAAWNAVWNAVSNVISSVWNAIRSTVSAAVSSVKSAISAGWNAAKSATSSAWSGIHSAVSSAISGIKSTVSSGISSARSAISSGWSSAKSLTSSAFSSMRSAVSSAVSSMLGTVRNIPGNVRNALGNLGGLLYAAGQSIIRGLVNGIQSMAGAVRGAVGNVLSAARNLLPFSPAKEGPFSGKGWTLYSGQAIVEGLATGITDRTPMLKTALSNTLAAAQPGLQSIGVGGNASSGALATSGAMNGTVTNVYNYTVTVPIQGIYDLSKGIPDDVARQLRDSLRSLDRSHA